MKIKSAPIKKMPNKSGAPPRFRTEDMGNFRISYNIN